MLEIFSKQRKQLECLFLKNLNKVNIYQISIFLFLKLINKKNYKIVIILSKHFAILNWLKNNNRYLACIIDNNIIINIAAIIFNNYNKFYIKFKQNSSSIK